MNYSWMLIEGFNFHHMVVFTFTDISKYKLPIYLIGWIVPHIIMLAYALARVILTDDTCWESSMGAWEAIHFVPAYMCFIVSFI